MDAKLRTAGEQLIGFLDESGHSSATEFFALAALVADDADWATFDRLWRDALRDSGAPYLHMRDFAHRVGVFRGWTEDQRRAPLARCVNAVNSIPAVKAQAGGTFDQLMDTMLSDPSKYHQRWNEMTPQVT